MLPPVPSLPPRSLWGCFVYCLKRENYARLSGRSTRKEYWGFMLFSILIAVAMVFLTAIGGSICGVCIGPEAMGLWMGAGFLAILVFLLYTAMPGLAVYVRRLHDVNWSGWWIALQFGLAAIIFGLAWFQIMLGVQEWMWMDENLTWDAETMRSLGAYLETTPPSPLLADLSGVLSLANNVLGLLIFILTVWPSQKKENRYGTQPLA